MPSFVFDHDTAKNLRELSPGSSFHFESASDHFSLALQRERCVLLLPGREQGMAAVLEMRRAPVTRSAAPTPQQPGPPRSQRNRTEENHDEPREEQREPRGILGLDGDAVYLDEEETQEQRPWWQRLFRS